MSFIQQIIQKAASNKKRIVLPESYDLRVLEAAVKVTQLGFAQIVLVGNEEKVKAFAPHLDFQGIEMVDPVNFAQKDDYVQTFYEMRKSKGVTLEQAEKTMLNEMFFGCMLVKKGFVDGMVAGAANTTANTLRPALQILKTAPGTKLVSGFFLMVVPDCVFGEQGTFVFADAGLNEEPDAEALSEIALSSAKSFELFTGKEAKVAMLSYSTKGSAKHANVDKMVEATRLTKEKNPSLAVDGELQLDAAIVPEIAASKAPGSDVAGKANVLIFPDLGAGNIGYKLVQRLAKAEAYGPLTQGIAKPVNDLSRGCSSEDIVGVVAITAVQAQAQEQAA